MNIDNLTKEQRDKILEFGVNKWYVTELLDEYIESPDKVPDEWKTFFKSINIKKEIHKYPEPVNGDKAVPIRGAGAKIIENMDSSLSIPTASSMRTVPVKILEENRRILNKYLSQRLKLKISFTHIAGWAIVKALNELPVMNYAYTVVNGEPSVIKRTDVNIGLAIDLIKKDGSRSLIVPNIKKANEMTFKTYFFSYNDIINRSRSNKIEVADLVDTTISLTNPGTIGTAASNPRLMLGQGTIIATGNIDYPIGFQAASDDTKAKLGISKVMNITSTYDHRIIQGAESGLFLKKIHELLIGKDNFYDEIFASLEIPTKPVYWNEDKTSSLESEIDNIEKITKHTRAIQLINMYRVRGHLIANLDPLNPRAQYHQELDPSNYGFTVWDYDREFATGGLGGKKIDKLRDILEILQQTYCSKIGAEYMHIQDPEVKYWLQSKMEPIRNIPLTNEKLKKRIYYKLTQAENFEKFIDKKYIGHKRFSLEGSETLIPVLDYMLENAAGDDIQEVVLGMSHRGRLNVLANIIGKPLYAIFSEFEDVVDLASVQGSGDVKYHLGASGTYTTMSGKNIKVTVASNASHLEFVDPVVEGIVRAKQTNYPDKEKNKFIPVLIHGDAAFAGEGIVAETLNLSELEGYRTGGTIHIIVNNQIGFTTSPQEGRSSVYATDVAKMIQAPIFHVNGDDPEAALWVTKLAYEYRMKYHKDVVIDIYAYRRLGHNETDEPAFTQPVMYSNIRKHSSVKELYREILIADEIIDNNDIIQIENEVHSIMDADYEKIKKESISFKIEAPLAISKDRIKEFNNDSGTYIGEDTFTDILRKITTLPGDFNLHPKLKRSMDARAKLTDGEDGIDWASAEALAFGALLLEKYPVRLSGQDSSRGTFSQRHLVLTDSINGNEYIPLNNISPEQAKIEPLDSLLSETAVLAFEYGYSTADPVTLVCWEAQFGDFANVAQPIIDNFVSSSNTKWQQPNNLTLLLPHGQEGQGAEHSSARLERFLTLCAEDNMSVIYPTTPAQYFHLLRKQAKLSVLKPLVVFTPKSLLRHPDAKSLKQEFLSGEFLPLIDDSSVEKSKIKTLILTYGKVYYELNKYRIENKRNDVSIIRIEQFYPFPENELINIINSYTNAGMIRFVQEEPENMGALNYMKIRISKLPDFKPVIKYYSRAESSSPAPGSYKVFEDTQKELISEVFK